MHPPGRRYRSSCTNGWISTANSSLGTLAPLARLSRATHVEAMSDRPSGAAPPRLVAVLGPTNTGKTHLAVERMLSHASGMIGLPLRLLAREIYDRVVK